MVSIDMHKISQNSKVIIFYFSKTISIALMASLTLYLNALW